MEEKKNKIIIYIMISIIILLVLGLSLYFILTKKDKADENSQVSKELTEELLEKADVTIKDYYDSKIVYIKDIPMQYKIGTILHSVESSSYDKCIEENNMEYCEYIEREDLKTKYEQFYYDEFSDLPKGNSYNECSDFINKDGTYYFMNHGCFSNILQKIVSSNKIDNSTIEIVAIIGSFDLDNHTITDYTNNKVVLTDSTISELEDESYTDALTRIYEKIDNIDEYKNNFIQYKFTYKLKNNVYTLYSIEPK